MSEHHATIAWTRGSQGFAYAEYNREHEWRLGSGTRILASAAPQFLGNGKYADPEEAFVASVSSCHMLTFLALCARKRITVNSYRDAAVGHLEKNEAGKLVISRVVLSPEIEFGEGAPELETLEALHHRSHEECFIANSISSAVEMARLS